MKIFVQISLFGNKVIDESLIRGCMQEFNTSRETLFDCNLSSCPSLVTQALKKRVYDFIKNDWRVTLDQFQDQMPGVSRSLLHEVVTKYLDYQKISARWDLKICVEQWLCDLTVEAYNDDTEKLVSLYDKCLNGHGNRVEK